MLPAQGSFSACCCTMDGSCPLHHSLDAPAPNNGPTLYDCLTCLRTVKKPRVTLSNIKYRVPGRFTGADCVDAEESTSLYASDARVREAQLPKGLRQTRTRSSGLH